MSNESKYLFPEPSIIEQTSDQLKQLISNRLPDAHDQDDGTDSSALVRIDVAQDHIEQARDILLSRGETFTEEEKEELSFLSWPLSPEEQRLTDARLEKERKENRRLARIRNDQCAYMKLLVFNIMNGYSLPSSTELDGYAIGLSSQPTLSQDLSSEQVLDVIDKIKELSGFDAVSHYVCSKPGVTFDEDDSPNWSLRVPLRALEDTSSRSYVSGIAYKHCGDTVTVSDQRKERPTEICFEIIHDLSKVVIQQSDSKFYEDNIVDICEQSSDGIIRAFLKRVFRK